MKKIFFILTIISIIAIAGIIFWHPQESEGDPNIPKEPSYYIELLERSLADPSNKGEQGLLELTKREDALGYEANIALARRLALQDLDPTEYYIKGLEIYNTKAIRYEFAQTLRARGQLNGAIEEYMKLLPDQTALEQLLELDASPVVIGEALMKGRHWQRAEEFLHPQLDRIEEIGLKNNLESQYAIVLGERGKFQQALTILEKIQKREGLNPELKWWYGRSLEATGNKKKALETYRELGAMGAYRLGILLEQEGRLEQAATAFTKSNQPISIWRGARIWDDSGKKDQALEAYRVLAQDGGIYQDDAAYRIYLLTSSSDERAQMLEILAPHPSWMIRLGQDPVWEPLPDDNYELPLFLQMVQVFQELGREDLASIELAIGEQKAEFEAMVALGNWYYDHEDYFRSVRWGIRAVREKPTLRAYQLSYPRPYGEYVYKYAEMYNLDPHLIWAIMREESHFRADVFSVAGARGLMQIMPATGKDIAHRLKIDYKDQDLLNPELNIRFGAFYIRAMLDMFNGDVDKALAAYNGGSGNVRRWSNTQLGSTLQGFPTAITFVETRNYITKVLNSYYIYQLLYSE